MLIALKAYYIAIAAVAGGLLFGHREIWSLITRRQLPPFDERVRENINKSVRNAFVFYIMAIAFLMLPFAEMFIDKTVISELLAILLVTGGGVYLLTYLYYERSKPNLSDRAVKVFGAFLITAGIAIAAFILGAFLHNLFYAIFKIDEAVFCIIAVILSPAALGIGVIGCAVIFFKGLFTSKSE